MGLSTEEIVMLLQLKGVGRKLASRLCAQELANGDDDLGSRLLEISRMKIIPRFPLLSKTEIHEAFDRGKTVIERSEKAGITLTSAFDPGYPKTLSASTDPPLVINSIGPLNSIKDKVAIAVIGTREPTDAGIKAGKFFGKVLGEIGYNVVSGLALGCDTAAHLGCLSGKGITTAILAHGLDTIYPKDNEYLSKAILDAGGILLSEYFIGTAPRSGNFVERDRIQAGISNATLVIQTGLNGGSMHAVNSTIMAGKPLSAVQYRGDELHSDQVSGNEKLILENRAFALTSGNLQYFLSQVFNTSLKLM